MTISSSCPMIRFISSLFPKKITSKHYNKTLSAHDNHEPFSRLSSADKTFLQSFSKKHIRVTAHYTAHIGIAPSFQTDRKTRKYHYQRYASLPHATAALFARHSSLTALTSIPDFSIPSYALPHKNGSRQFLACPHSGSAHPTRPVCIYIFNYQGTHANLRWRAENPLPVLDKISSGLASPKST